MAPNPLPREPRRRESVHPHLLILAVCLAVVATGAVLRPSTAAEPGLGLGPIALPHGCGFRALTGLPCPGCGLTRSVVAAVHGDFTGSLDQHRLGLPVVVYLLLQIIANGTALAYPWWRKRGAQTMRYLNLALIPLALALLVNWIPTLMSP